MFGADIGALAPLFLQIIKLSPGEALFLDTGTLHTYLKETCLEVIADSDNAIRGGLTTKHVYRNNLLSVTDFNTKSPVIQTGKANNSGVHFYIPYNDFQFSVINIGENVDFNPGRSGSAELLLVLEGELKMSEQDFKQGGSIFIPPNADNIDIRGHARLAHVYTSLSDVVNNKTEEH